MTEEQLSPVEEAEVGVEESETGSTETESSSVDSSTISRTSEYAKGSTRFNGVLLNLLLAIFVVVALIAHVQLGKSELLTPSKAGGITPRDDDVPKPDSPEEPKAVQEVPAAANLEPQFGADNEEDFSESDDELETFSEDGDDDVLPSPETPVETAKDPIVNAGVSASEEIKTTKQEVPSPPKDPDGERVSTKGTVDVPSVGAEPSPVHEIQAPKEVVRESEKGPQKQPETQEAAEDKAPVDAGHPPAREDKLPQQEVPVPPTAEVEPQDKAEQAKAEQDVKPPPTTTPQPTPTTTLQPTPTTTPQPTAEPPAAVKEVKKTHEGVPPLLARLKEPMFESPFAVNKDDLQPFKGMLQGPPEGIVTVQGFPVPRSLLQDLLGGGWVDVSVLQIYSNLVNEHIEQRVAMGLQSRVAVLNPVDFSVAWQLFVKEGKTPVVNRSSIERSLTADMVIFAMTAPLGDWNSRTGHNATGHYIVAVIDRVNHRVSIVDSLPHPPRFYDPVVQFLKLVAEQLHDPADGPVPVYKASPHVPEPGFPRQIEAVPGGASFFGGKDLTNACGPFCMENIICIAEGRKPNYSAKDAKNIRLRVLLELLDGIWDRPLINGHMREGFGGSRE